MIVIKKQGKGTFLQTGISSRTTLYNREERGNLTRIMPGVFVESAASLGTINVMQWLSLRQPHAVMNLLSALSFHEVTTQIPQYLSVALPRGKWLPKVLIMPVKAWFVTPSLLLEGYEEHEGDYGTFKVTTLERTIVDCFKYRNKIGLDLFMEAQSMARSRLDLWKLQEEASRQRILASITPYLKMSR